MRFLSVSLAAVRGFSSESQGRVRRALQEACLQGAQAASQVGALCLCRIGARSEGCRERFAHAATHRVPWTHKSLRIVAWAELIGNTVCV